jgi:hypothetical protein
MTIDHGHATVKKSSGRNTTIEGNLSSSRSLNEILLSATANILVHHLAEVIAVTASGDSLFTVQGQMGETTTSAKPPFSAMLWHCFPRCWHLSSIYKVL